MIALPRGNRGQTRRRTHREIPGVQIGHLLYPGFAICRTRQFVARGQWDPPCRMQFGDTADYKSALRHLRTFHRGASVMICGMTWSLI